MDDAHVGLDEESGRNSSYKIDKKFAEEMVVQHNVYRQIHGVPPLQLSMKLCQVAQEWAENLAEKNKCYHRPNPIYGENTYFMWTNEPGVEATAKNAVSLWYSEIKLYKFGSNAKQKGCGHFTQLIWNASKKVGSGYAKSKNGTKYIVSNYYPPGNWKNKYAEHVFPPLKTTRANVDNNDEVKGEIEKEAGGEYEFQQYDEVEGEDEPGRLCHYRDRPIGEDEDEFENEARAEYEVEQYDEVEGEDEPGGLCYYRDRPIGEDEGEFENEAGDEY